MLKPARSTPDQHTSFFMTTLTKNNAPSGSGQVVRENGPVMLRKPLYNVTGNVDAYAVRVLMPGVAKDGVSVDFEDNVLTVHGKRSLQIPAEWKGLHSEIPTADFQLRLRLNAPVDEEKMTASMQDGVLTLHLPVKETAKPRRIQVQ
jgi:HSP20 family protein